MADRFHITSPWQLHPLPSRPPLHTHKCANKQLHTTHVKSHEDNLNGRKCQLYFTHVTGKQHVLSTQTSYKNKVVVYKMNNILWVQFALQSFSRWHM